MTVFVTWPFPATGTSVTRTLPDRLADYYNVKDFGAIGNDSDANDTADTNGIQGAINACIAGGGGTVYLPQGSYKVKSPITCGSDTNDVGVRIIGTGKSGTSIFASASYADPSGVGAVIAAGPVGSLPTYDCIESIQGIWGLNCRCTRAGVSIIDCTFSGLGADDTIAVDVSFADGASVIDCSFGGTYTGTPADVTAMEQCLYPNGVCLAIGNGTVIASRGGNGAGIAVAISGTCFAVGNSFEVGNIGYRIGWGPATIGAACSEKAAYGAVIGAMQTERVNIPVDVYNGTACFITGIQTTGGFNAQGLGQTIIGATWNVAGPNIARMETAAAHNLPVGDSQLALNTVGTGNDDWKPDIAEPNVTGWILATRVDATHFDYTLPVDPGVFNYPTGSPTEWGYALFGGIRFRIAVDCFVNASQLTAVSLNSLDFDYGGDVNALHNNNTMIGVIAATGAIMPTVTENRAGWKFTAVSLDWNSVADIFGDTVTSVSGVTRFQDLPGETGVNQSGPYEGMEYSIIDCTLTSSGNFATVVSSAESGGANNVKLRYDGTDWRISG